MSDDMRKFFRYVTPGLVYGVVTLLLFLIALTDKTLCVLRQTGLKDSVGAAVIGFLASNGIGFVFAAIHHHVRWYCGCDKDILDNRKIIKELDKEGLIQLDASDKVALDRNDIEAKRKAEATAFANWYPLLKEEHGGRNQNDNLGHQAHGLGTARIASVFAVVTLIVVIFYIHDTLVFLDTVIPTFFALMIGVLIIFLFHRAYERVAYFAQYTFEKMLRAELIKSAMEENRSKAR